MKRVSSRVFSALLLAALLVSTLGSSLQTSVLTKSIATIPVEVPSYGLLFLQARVNGSGPMSFVLDTGEVEIEPRNLREGQRIDGVLHFISLAQSVE